MELLRDGAGEGTAVGTYADGYSLLVDRAALPYAGAGLFRFRILGEDGHTVQGFDPRRGARMHLMVVRRRTLTHFRYLRASASLDGAWSAPLELPEPGIYRAIVEFSVGGVELALGADITASGATQARPVPEPALRASVAGYEVSLDAPALGAGVTHRISFRVRRLAGGDPDNGPGAGADLVALREGDLALLHGRPLATTGATLDYEIDFPGEGRYRLFLRFVGWEVGHTAAFTVEVPR